MKQNDSAVGSDLRALKALAAWLCPIHRTAARLRDPLSHTGPHRVPITISDFQPVDPTPGAS